MISASKIQVIYEKLIRPWIHQTILSTNHHKFSRLINLEVLVPDDILSTHSGIGMQKKSGEDQSSQHGHPKMRGETNEKLQKNLN